MSSINALIIDNYLGSERALGDRYVVTLTSNSTDMSTEFDFPATKV